MENSIKSSNQNDNPRPNLNSMDGFTRPAPSSNPTSSSDGVVSSISIPPSDSDSQANSEPTYNGDQQSNTPVLSAPITSGNMDQKKSKIWTAVLILLILIIFVGGLYGVYAYQQKKINTANSTISAQNAQIALLKTQLSSQQSKPTVSINTQPSTSTATVFKMPELGVSLAVPTNLADISYTTNAAKTQANLTTANLVTLDPACASSATAAPLGSIVKTTGNFPTTPSTTTTLIKQYPTYYIAYIKPAAACSTVTQVNNLTNALITDLKSTFTSIALLTT